MVTLKFSEAKVFRRSQSKRALLRVQIDILKSSLSYHYSPLKYLELHIQKGWLQKALVTIHHVVCSILWKTTGKKYRTRVMSSFVFTVLAAPGFMCSSIPASTSLPLVHQAALPATCRPQVRTAAAFYSAQLNASCTHYRSRGKQFWNTYLQIHIENWDRKVPSSIKLCPFNHSH